MVTAVHPPNGPRPVDTCKCSPVEPTPANSLYVILSQWAMGGYVETPLSVPKSPRTALNMEHTSSINIPLTNTWAATMSQTMYEEQDTVVTQMGLMPSSWSTFHPHQQVLQRIGNSTLWCQQGNRTTVGTEWQPRWGCTHRWELSKSQEWHHTSEKKQWTN